jgi:hypothetical protein
MHTTATTTTSNPAIELFLDTVRGDHDGPNAWAEDAVLDAVVPGASQHWDE